MSKDYDRYNKFTEKYDMHADGIEEEVVEFLKENFQKLITLLKKT